ncbi:MAG: antibiotic biosynthesis monooxygenase family protein, partial [Bryobacteraceae bacterium]
VHNGPDERLPGCAEHCGYQAVSEQIMNPHSKSSSQPVQLHVDLDLDPSKEQDLIRAFRESFEPAIRQQQGFVDVELLKLRSVMAGKGPENFSYRLLVSFEREEDRQRWVASDTHQKVWPVMESNLKGSLYGAVLYDVV